MNKSYSTNKVLYFIGVFATYAFITDRAAHKFGITPENTSLMLSVMGVANFAGKIIFGSFLDRFRNKSVTLTTVILLLNAASVLGAEFWPGIKH